MMRTNGRFFKAVLTAVVVLTAAATAFTQTPDIKWFTKNPNAKSYQISTADELAGLAALVNNTAGLDKIDLAKYGHRSSTRNNEYETDANGEKNCAVDFKGKTVTLTQNIDLSKYCRNSKYNNGKGWIPIGGSDGGSWMFQFEGTFDGGGKTITGLAVKGVSMDGDGEGRLSFIPGGLFGYVSGTVKNVGVADANISGVGGGGIVGTLYDGSVSNCYFTGTIVGTDTVDGGYGASVGGIVGWLKDGNIANCYFAGTATGLGSVGGIAGDIDAGIIGIWGEKRKATGGSISNCYSAGTLRGDVGVGGIVGSLRDGVGGVSNSYSTAAVSGTVSVGGIVGYVSNLVNSDKYQEARMTWLSDEVYNNDNDDGRPSKDFKTTLKNIKLFDTLKTAIANNAALNSSVKAAGTKKHSALIYAPASPSWEMLGPYRAGDSSFSRGGRIVGGNDGRTPIRQRGIQRHIEQSRQYCVE